MSTFLLAEPAKNGMLLSGTTPRIYLIILCHALYPYERKASIVRAVHLCGAKKFDSGWLSLSSHFAW